MSRIKYRDYEIEIWVELYDPNDPHLPNVFYTLKEARDYLKCYPMTSRNQIRWACAEIINKNGDVNPSVKGKTRREALYKLKRILYPSKHA